MKRVKNEDNAFKPLWLAPNYPVHWAENPSEVTQWDVSRGVPLSGGLNGRNESELRSAASGFLREQMARDDFDPVLGMSKREYELQNSFSSPSRRAPAEGYPRLVRANFDKAECGELQHSEDVLGELSPLARPRFLENWRAGKPAQVLLNKIAKAASKYGPPFTPTGNTLLAWLALIIHVDIHTRALRDLQTSPDGLQAMIEGLEERYREVKQRIRARIGETPEVRYVDRHPLNAREKMHLLDPVFELWDDASVRVESQSYLLPVECEFRWDLKYFVGQYGTGRHQSADLNRLELLQVGLLLQTALSEKDQVKRLYELESGELDDSEQKELKKLLQQVKDAIRTRVANMLTSVFEDSSANYSSSIEKELYAAEHHLSMAHKGVVLACPVGVWVDLKLAELWRNNLALQVCKSKSCGAIFAPTHGSALYCKAGGCADKVMNDKKRLRVK